MHTSSIARQGWCSSAFFQTAVQRQWAAKWMLTFLPCPSLFAITRATVTLTMTCPESRGKNEGGQEETRYDLRRKGIIKPQLFKVIWEIYRTLLLHCSIIMTAGFWPEQKSSVYRSYVDWQFLSSHSQVSPWISPQSPEGSTSWQVHSPHTQVPNVKKK